MIYQLAKTSVGLSGQVKWDLIINSGKVSDLQIVPIHESIPYNYAAREDALNNTHIQNLQKLFKKISNQFFEPVIDPRFCTGYPTRNHGCRIETHENSYEMGMKRNKSYQRYKKQFSFFCPIWCDDLKELNSIVFKIVIKDGRKGSTLYTREIDHSLIKDYLQQYALSSNLNSDLIYISFQKKESWITGVNVENGVVQTKNTLGLIEDITSRERPMLEVDNMILSQFSKRNMIAKQLFNFNFEFNLGDIVIPGLLRDFSGEQLNVYVDCFYTDSYGSYKQVPFRDIYSNYDYISRYDIPSGKFIKNNCFDYLHDNSNIDLIGQNKLVQNTFHWSLSDNDKYIFNLYDGCCPVYTDATNTYECKGLYFDTPDLFAREYDKMKNPLNWLKPFVAKPGCSVFDISEVVTDVIRGEKKEYGITFAESQNKTEEYIWRNNIKFKRQLPKIKKGDTPRLSKLTVYLLYFPKTTFDRYEIRTGFFPSLMSAHDPFNAEDNIEKNVYFFEHLAVKNDDEIQLFLKNSHKPGGSFYTIISRKSATSPFDTLIFLFPDNRPDATDCYLDNDLWNSKLITHNIINDSSLKNIFSYSINYHVPEHENPKYKEGSYGANNIDGSLKLFFKEAERTIRENLANICPPETIVFNNSVSSELVNIPQKLTNWRKEKMHESIYYKNNAFSYVFRYDGKLLPMFIDGNNPLLYNYVYITKQFNKQINVLDVSDDDMVDFNTYLNTKFSPIYPSFDYFPLRKKICKYNIYHRGSRRYYWEKSWFKKNSLFVLPEEINITVNSTGISTKRIKSLLRKQMFSKLTINAKGDKIYKMNIIFDNFIFPLYDYSYETEYANKNQTGLYTYKIKYILK